MLIIVLPAYNEAETIGPLLESLERSMKDDNLEYQAIIVNDGSDDNTASIVQGFADKMPVEIVDHPTNRGLPEAIKTGLLAAVSRCNERDIIIMLDADNSHTPGLILRMTRMIKEGSTIVIASRYLKDSRIRGVPCHRNLLSWGASFLFRIFLPIKGVKDYTCGYRAYRAAILKKAFEIYGEDFISQPGFSCVVDILLKLRKLDPIVTEAPLILRYDLKHSTSKMDIKKTIGETLCLIFRTLFKVHSRSAAKK